MVIAQYFVEFIFYSFLGWVWESIYCSINEKKWADRWDKIDDLIIEADDAHFKALFENLIESGKTDVFYNSRSICDWKHGTLVKYLKRYKVLIKSDKGKLITRSIACLLMDEDGLPLNFRFAIYRAYRDGKIPRTWKKYA